LPRKMTTKELIYSHVQNIQKKIMMTVEVNILGEKW
jgi:hypothetical protein